MKHLADAMHTIDALCIFEKMQICKHETNKYDRMKEEKMKISK
jgi:hypothetical protein